MKPALWFAGLSLIASPFFFTLFRLAVFNTVPHDDYTPYLLWLDGSPLGGIPESPYCYRLLSMAMAWPLFWLMPVIPLTNMPVSLAPDAIRAVASLTLLSYLAGIATALLTYRLGRTEGGLRPGHAMAAGALAWALAWYTQVTAIDTLALLFITAALCAIGRPAAFAAILLVSVGVNEKIALVLAIWLVLRGVLDAGFRHAFGLQIAIGVGAVVLYAVLVAVLRMPGNEYQLQPGGFLGTITENLYAYASGRGVLLNVLPIAVLAGLALLRPTQESGLFRRADILLIPALMAVALVLTHLFQAGRIVMHAAPFFVVPALAALQSRQAAGLGRVP